MKNNAPIKKYKKYIIEFLKEPSKNLVHSRESAQHIKKNYTDYRVWIKSVKNGKEIGWVEWKSISAYKWTDYINEIDFCKDQKKEDCWKFENTI